MYLAQTCFTFAKELQSLGITIPDNTVKIQISITPNKMVTILFKIVRMGDNQSRWEAAKIVTPDGKLMAPFEFISRLSKVVTLPGGIVAMNIICEMNNVVTISCEWGLPEGSLEHFKDCTFEIKK